MAERGAKLSLSNNKTWKQHLFGNSDSTLLCSQIDTNNDTKEAQPELRDDIKEMYSNHIIIIDECHGLLFREPKINNSEPIIVGESPPSPLRITMTDSLGPYVCHHFTECENTSSNVLKNTRGIISKNGNIVCKTFNFTPEYVGKSQEAINALTSIDWNNTIFYPAHEGTNLRLWNDEGIWHLSSFKKIDAFRSKWGCRESHGQIFFEGIEYMLKNNQIVLTSGPQAIWDELIKTNPDQKACFDFYCSLLFPSTVYTFVVLSTAKNRIVCNPGSHPQPIYFTGEFTKSDWVLTRDNSSGICPPEANIECDIENMPESLFKWIEGLNPYQWQGIMIHYGVGTSSFGSIKLTAPSYQALATLRGNWPSIPFRYLQLREWPDQAQAFRNLYPEHVKTFDEYETILDNLAEEVLAGYILRYIKKEFVVLPQELFFVAKDLNKQWQEDYKRVTKQTVTERFNSLGSIKLNYFIRKAKERSVQDLLNE